MKNIRWSNLSLILQKYNTGMSEGLKIWEGSNNMVGIICMPRGEGNFTYRNLMIEAFGYYKSVSYRKGLRVAHFLDDRKLSEIRLPLNISPNIQLWFFFQTAQQRLRAMLAQQTGNTTTAPAYKAQNGTSSQGCAPAAMLVGQAAALQPSAAAPIAVVKSDIEWSF